MLLYIVKLFIFKYTWRHILKSNALICKYRWCQILPQLHVKVADPVISEYLRGGITFDIVQEHVKAEEQKFIRKAKRYTLYDEQPYRIK